MSINIDALFPKLINLLLDTVFVVDELGNIVFVSDACQQLLGYSADELTGTPVLNYIHPDDRERTVAAARNVMRGQPHTDFRNRYRHKDGRVVHILWSARWSAEDQLRIAVARDVTALYQAEQTRNALYRISEAAHAAETLRALCDGVREVISELFPESSLYLAFNDAGESTLSVPDWSAGQEKVWAESTMEPGTAIAEVIGTGRVLMASGDPARPGMGRISPSESAAADWLGVPLISRDAVLGALVIESPTPGARYGVADQELLQFMATQLAIMFERKRADERLRFLAHHDPLTGLTNRSLFYDRLETALRSASRNEGRLALLYLDLNDFKKINDTEGHEAGDKMLIEMARRLEDCTRDTDTVARIGGDEFTVLLTDVHGRASVEAAVGKIREFMSLPMKIGGKTFHASCSIGTALYPEDGATARELLSKADANMYLGKRR